MSELKRLTVDQIPPQCPSPFCATRDDFAPTFEVDGYINGEVKSFRLEDYIGKWIILFFYSSDFTFV
ncbi:redoxin domain-containing protein [Bacillus aquiflavi]|nr:redoxin domain-containing protein [Bacillus aquiflavi]